MKKPHRSFAYASQEMQARLPVNYGELFDICEEKHRSNPQSQEAFETIKDKITEGQGRVLRAIRNSEEFGATVDEIAIVLGCHPNEISGRASELKRDGKIIESGRRFTRKGKCTATVLKLA